MKSIRAVSIIIALAATQFAATPPAWADECTDAVLDYNEVLSQLTDAMEKFSTCIADSKGTDNCLHEFNRLRSAHGQFAAAVSVYVKQCR